MIRYEEAARKIVEEEQANSRSVGNSGTAVHPEFAVTDSSSTPSLDGPASTTGERA